MSKHKSRKLEYCRFLPYRRARTGEPKVGEEWIDVSSRADSPFDQFSPFYPHGGIPIPGMKGQTADSVEGIWQGLKVIRGKIAPRFFEGGGQKRVGKPHGHQFGQQTRLLNLVEARQKIYSVAYRWVLENRISGEVIREIINRAFRGISQCFYDREDNGSIGKDMPLAHASLLVQFLNEQIDNHGK